LSLSKKAGRGEPNITDPINGFAALRVYGTTTTPKEAVRMRLQKENEIRTITEIIKETVDCEKIYLFGSYAYGEPHKDSDMDFYVVVPDDAGRPIKDICGGLTDYSASARYPDHAEIEETDAASALKGADRIYAFCAALIPALR
jgi:predicted nucleotidyltransferase